jgi:hypothetical protein
MARGGKREGAGRKPNSITKKKIDVYAALESAGCDPVAELLSLAKAAKEGVEVATKSGVAVIPDYNLAARIYLDLLSYSAPKLKAAEHKEKSDEEGANDRLVEAFIDLAKKLPG